MKLVCKQNTFKFSKNIGLGPFFRTENFESKIPLSVGKSYFCSPVISDDNFKCLLIFTDNLKWELISGKDVLLIIDDGNSLINYSKMIGWDKLIQSIFENPEKEDENQIKFNF